MLEKIISSLTLRLFRKKKPLNRPDETWLYLHVKVTFHTSFQVKYRSTDGFNKIKEFLGQEATLETLPSRDISVFVNNNTLKTEQTVTISLFNGEQLVKSRVFAIPSDCHFTPWLPLND